MKSPSILLSLVAAVTMTFGVSTSSVQGQADQGLRAWGRNSSGQCNIPYDLGVCTQIAGGLYHTIALRQDGVVRAWGYNEYGQCNIPSDLGVCTQIAGSSRHTIALRQDGIVRVWGTNINGQCDVPSDLGVCTQIAGGYENTIAIQQSGIVRAWGRNDYGQCNIPSDLGACMQIAGGVNHTIALRQDGIVRVWGVNNLGQSNIPSDLGVCTQIAGGAYHTIALQESGLVRAWGLNQLGQCNIPSDLGVCTQIAGGRYQSIAIQQSGLVRAWGNDGDGQCTIPSDLGVCTRIAGGGFHTIAIRPSNTSDVDGDGIPAYLDNCQTIANPTQADCDSDGIGDVCENAFIASTTANMGAFSFATPASGTIGNCVRATGPVTVTITVVAYLGNNTNEYATLKIGGVVIENFLFLTTGHDCPATPDVATLIVSAATWNSFVAQYGANVPVQIVGAVLVDPAECASPFSTVAVRYGGPNFDCNGNGIADFCEIASGAADCDSDGALDACEIAQGLVPDCNGNGIPDTCDIATGFAKDCNLNTIPDSCDIATAFAKDCDLNTVPDSCDIASGIAKDCNLNGIPDSCDIASTFAKDCNANGIPDSCDIATGISVDIDGNSKPDECQTTSLTSGGNIQGAINSASASELRIVTLGAGTYSGPISITDKAIIIRGAGAANTIIQGTGGASSSVLKMENNPAISLIEGVTIRGGLTGTLYPNSPPQNLVGGGIFMLNSAGSIRNCIIESNFAGYGGGAYVFGCTGTISNCIFRNNNVSADGGGIQLYGGAPKVVDTVVENNFANGRGAGMHVVQGAPELLRVNIRNNVSNNIVGGLSWYGLLSPSAFLKVTSCQVTSNSALVVQGGIGISSPSQANISILDSVVCGNVPQPNISGVWENLGGNTVCKCIGDIVVNGSVDGTDLAIMISQLQTSGSEPSADLDESGFVDGIDLAMLLSGWGACPSNGSITSITPAFGPTSGGTAITITGIGFGNVTSVKFGGIAATNVVATPTTVTAVTPARAAGVVDVAVSGPSQYVVATSAFTYTVVPPWATLLELTPDPAVVTDANLRAAIVASGFAWRVRDNAANIEMLLVPMGTFTMGCNPGDAECGGDENPAHQVTLTNAFYMGKTEVTQAQWTAKMGSNPSYFSGSSDSPSRPVEEVSWDTIQNFNSATGLRLPTEAEWEYACRAGTTTARYGDLNAIAWYWQNWTNYGTQPVAGKLPNALGLYDTIGNVWEWCQDWYGPYSSGSVTNPTGPATGSYRLRRGGSWVSASYLCSGSLRYPYGPNGPGSFGFRVVRTP